MRIPGLGGEVLAKLEEHHLHWQELRYSPHCKQV